MALTEEQQALCDLMSDTSERIWFASWLDETEYRLWAFMTNPSDDGRWGRETLDDSRRPELSKLSQRIGGWIRYDEGAADVGHGERFVTLDEWLPMYEAEMVRRTKAGEKW